MRQYNYKMGIVISWGSKKEGTKKSFNLPDPSKWSYQVGDLDTSGSRDATGYLHRAYVATKINYEFSWNALEWEMLDGILAAVKHEKFTMKAPDPRDFNKTYTGEYYVGDRTGECSYFITDTVTSPVTGAERAVKPEVAQFSLKLKFIEY